MTYIGYYSSKAALTLRRAGESGECRQAGEPALFVVHSLVIINEQG
jgi:hypothetical protein